MEKVRGLFIIGFISWRAYLQNLENRKGPFWKRVKRDGVSLINRLEGRGFGLNALSTSFPRVGRQGRGRRLAGGADSGGQGLGAAPG